MPLYCSLAPDEAQAGEVKLREVVTNGGFTQFCQTTETPINMILEAWQ